HISTDTSRVRRWLDGENPREPIPRILSELFSERFGCVVAVEDLGLRPAHQSPSVSGIDLPCTGPQTVAMISEFSRSDLMLASRLPRDLAGPVRRPVPHRARAALAGAEPRLPARGTPPRRAVRAHPRPALPARAGAPRG